MGVPAASCPVPEPAHVVSPRPPEIPPAASSIPAGVASVSASPSPPPDELGAPWACCAAPSSAEYRLPQDAQLASQYLLLYEMSVPYGLDVGDQIHIDKRSLRLNVTYGDVDLDVISTGAEAARAWLQQHGPASTHEPLASGPVLMFSQITRRNIAGMVLGTGFGFSLIAVILAMSLRSTRLGLLSLLPNALPAGIAFGVWAMLHGEVGFAISIVAGLAMGIIVDDTVHFLVKYSHARQQLAHSPQDAVAYAFDAVGSALLGTSLIVAAGFGVLALSSFRVTAYMGTLTALTVVTALATDFLLLPALLLWLDREQTPVPAGHRRAGSSATA